MLVRKVKDQLNITGFLSGLHIESSRDPDWSGWRTFRSVNKEPLKQSYKKDVPNLLLVQKSMSAIQSQAIVF